LRPLDVDIASIAPAGARFEDGEIARIVVDRPTDNVNAIDPPLIAALGRAVADAREARPRGLVIVSAKPDQFVAGADLTMLANRPSAAELSQGSREIQRIFSDLASLPFPTVAAINGSALGGGYELALACDWRIAADAPSVRVGLPEVSLGLLPGAGGTQRLPRLVGLPRALDQILNARRSNARRALRAGLVDEVVHPAALERAALDRARKGEKRKVQGGASLVDRAATWLAPARAFALRQARAGALAETKGHYPAPLKALEAIAIGLGSGMEAGLEAEARLFGELATSDVSRNLIALFLLGLAQRRAAYEGLLRGEAPNDMAIVGAGLMGSCIAQSAAMGGAPVPRMPLVEVVRPEKADPRALARVVAEAQAMGKTAIVVRDTPGFYTTRVLGFMLAEAMSMLEEGARIEDIDRAMVAFGWPIGPLALTDEVGLVVARHVGETVAAARGITNAPSAVQRLTDAGMQGQRNGRG